jgi:N4-(beta-N-acetylglucosaminyl)-L-asparaginase
MRQGSKPLRAAEDAVRRILKFYPSYVGAVVAVACSGKHAGAAAGWDFEYAVRSPMSDSVEIVKVTPISKLGPTATLLGGLAQTLQHIL